MTERLTTAVKDSLQGLLGTATINKIAPVVADRLKVSGLIVPSEPKANYDRIRSMSIEEMAAYHARNITCGRCEARKMCKELHTDSEFKELNCVDRFQKWLESEAL